MRLVALLPVRDEADIVGECLSALLLWADRIIVYDTGSLDETWEAVQGFASRERRLVALKRNPAYFSETLVRRYLFEVARQEMKTGDWFARVDADEFHHLSPREFIRERLSKTEGVIYHQYYDFCLLESEAERLRTRSAVEEERRKPIEERRRHYMVMQYAEPRFCRYRESMRWAPDCSFPYNAGLVARARMPIRHYPRRDPLQLAKRCALRAVMMSDATNRRNWTRPELHHWSEGDWRKFVTPDSEPGLRVWNPGEELPELRQMNHLRRPAVRAAQYLLHRFAVRGMDAMRPRVGLVEPQPIPETVQEAIQETYGAVEAQWA